MDGQTAYYFNPHALPLFLSAGLMALLGLRAITAKRSALNAYFSGICISVTVWLLFTGLGYLVRNDPKLAAFWFTLDWVGVAFISINVYAFSMKLLNLDRPKSIRIGYGLAVMFAIITLDGNPLMAGVKKYPWGFFPIRDFKWSAAFLAFFFMYMGQSLTDYILAYRKCTDQVKRNQIKYMFVAFLIAYIGSIDYLPTYGIKAYPFGFVMITCFVAICGYTILTYRLMDITVIIRKTLVYSAVMGTLTIVYLGVITLFAKVFQGLAGFQTVFSSAIAASLVTLGFQPLRKRVQGFVDAKFFRQYVDREEKLYELSREVITHTTPEAMSQALMRVIGDTLHPKFGALYLKSRDGSGYVPTAPVGEKQSERMVEDNPLARYFADHPQPFVQDLSDDVGRSRSTRKKDARGEAAA